MDETFDVVVVGAGTAGCVLAARLSEEPGRRVCLVEAGPDYGPLGEGRWPADILDARALTFTHDWGRGGEDDRSLGARVVGGCSAHNACIALRGSRDDYDEWWPEWADGRLDPYLERAAAMLRVQHANTERPAPPHAEFVAAARANGLALLGDPNDPAQPVGVAAFPANVVDGVRWNAAFAYLDPARGRPGLRVVGGCLVDRLMLEGGRCAGVLTADGRRLRAGLTVLAAGAYLTPAVLLRSGIGPGDELRHLGVEAVADLPVGARLLDHHGTSLSWEPTPELDALARAHEAEAGPLFEPHAFVKAASSACPAGTWDLHLLSWVTPRGDGRYEAAVIVFHMKPRSRGRLTLRTLDPGALPHVERGLGADPADVDVVVEGMVLARTLAATEPLRGLLGTETTPGEGNLAEHVRGSLRNYFHPAGTCPIGDVVDPLGRILGIDELVVADASIMPTIPRANTNLTVAALAERIAETL